ncbi:MAG: hypothetical protein ACOYJ6_11180 [Caulobacterales bacterium]
MGFLLAGGAERQTLPPNPIDTAKLAAFDPACIANYVSRPEAFAKRLGGSRMP